MRAAPGRIFPLLKANANSFRAYGRPPAGINELSKDNLIVSQRYSKAANALGYPPDLPWWQQKCDRPCSAFRRGRQSSDWPFRTPQIIGLDFDRLRLGPFEAPAAMSPRALPEDRGRTVRPLRRREDGLRRDPWAAGTNGVPLPTAIQCQPLRDFERGRHGSKSNVSGDRLRSGPTHQATRFAGSVRLAEETKIVLPV